MLFFFFSRPVDRFSFLLFPRNFFSRSVRPRRSWRQYFAGSGVRCVVSKVKLRLQPGKEEDLMICSFRLPKTLFLFPSTIHYNRMLPSTTANLELAGIIIHQDTRRIPPCLGGSSSERPFRTVCQTSMADQQDVVALTCARALTPRDDSEWMVRIEAKLVESASVLPTSPRTHDIRTSIPSHPR